MLIRRSLAVAFFGLMSAAGFAYASGGTDIASAPELPAGKRVAGGGDPGRDLDTTQYWREFWRITLRGEDRLTVDYGSTNGPLSASLCLLAPGVTDSTFADKPCVTGDGRDQTNTTAQRRYIVPEPGRYTLVISSEPRSPLAYVLTAHVLHHTTTKLNAPRTVHARSRVTFTGKVSGADSGRVELQLLVKGGWVKLASVPVRKNGTFTVRTASGAPGTYRLRALYSGNASHLRSGTIIRFTVVK